MVSNPSWMNFWAHLSSTIVTVQSTKKPNTKRRISRHLNVSTQYPASNGTPLMMVGDGRRGCLWQCPADTLIILNVYADVDSCEHTQNDWRDQPENEMPTRGLWSCSVTWPKLAKLSAHDNTINEQGLEFPPKSCQTSRLACHSQATVHRIIIKGVLHIYMSALMV